MHYDFAFTCRGSLGPDADEVGACVRRLLLAHARAGRRCVAFVGRAPEPGFSADCAHPVEIVVVAAPPTPPCDNLRGPELAHSHALFARLDAFLREGHTLRLVEFPDRDAEGWFFIQHNLVRRRVPLAVVRLHGGRHLLDEDNGVSATPLADALLQVAEREAVFHADHVLHAGEALLDRVLACHPPRDDAALRARCVALPPPPAAALSVAQATRQGSPPPLRRVACLGPLEYRFGADLLILEAVRHFRARPDSTLEIHCLGPDTPTADGASFHDYLRALVPEDLSPRFVVATSPSALAPASALGDFAALVYPARFAAHPAQLDAAAGFEGPVFVSRRGDLPLFASALRDARAFDPQADADWFALFAALESPPSRDTPAAPPRVLPREPDAFDRTAYSKLHDTPAPALRAVKLAVVTPHLDDIDNLEKLVARLAAHPARERIEFFVVDDGTPPDAFDRVARLCAAHAFVTLLRTPRPRSGPAVARHLALRNASADYAVFVDADDHIDVDAYLHYASALDANPGLDAVYPIQRFFGWETHDWLPGPRGRSTLFADAFNHIGILARKTALLAAFARAGSANFHLLHAEDAFHSAALLFNGARIITAPEVAYYYNRSNPASLSRSRQFRKWQARAELRRFYERLLAEAMAEGTLPPCDIRLLRRLSLALPGADRSVVVSRGVKVPWHTHLFRALRSLAGDRRYRP